MVNLTSPKSTPRVQPAEQVDVNELPTPRDNSIGGALKMPHERDESADMTDEKINPQIEQAAVDLKRGLQDTSKGAELNRAYAKLK